MKYASVLLAVGCLVTAAYPQWLEETILLPDSLGGLASPQCLVYDSANNTVYVGGESTDCEIAVDGVTSQ